MQGRKGSKPENVRPYRLDYRPLIDRDLTDKAIRFIEKNAKTELPSHNNSHSLSTASGSTSSNSHTAKPAMAPTAAIP